MHRHLPWWNAPAAARSPAAARVSTCSQVGGSGQVPDKEMYVILNSGTWAPDHRGGPPDETTAFPNAFEVDYVRVYQGRGAAAPR